MLPVYGLTEGPKILPITGAPATIIITIIITPGDFT
jgi:hypothetical protein